MDKKFDFKTIAIACLLFFGFVFLLFYKFSSADDSITHYKTALEIFDSQQSFDDFRDTLPTRILPEWYTETESMANLLYTIGCFAMGDYIGVAEGLVTELSGQITGDPLFLEHFVFDYDSLSWVFDSDTDDFIKSKLDPLIYTSSGGYWYSLPLRVKVAGTSEYYNFSSISGSGYIGFYTENNYHKVVAVSNDSGFKVQCIGGDNPSINCNIAYTGEKTSGFYRGSAVLARNYSFLDENGDSLYSFSSINDALTDYFGYNPSMGDSVLIDGVSIRNDDFTVSPLSYPSSVMVDYPSLITEPDYDPDDYRLIFEYTPTMEVPFWLKNPTTEPISYELPTDYDFGNIEYEYEADPSYLAGAGIVQDVFEILPASLQGLIALFGAGSLAFIFLRR